MTKRPNTRRLLAWLSGEVKSPPFSREARREAGGMLGQLPEGEKLSLPHSRPMPGIGKRCHELRVSDETTTWRIRYRLDVDAVVILEVFSKQDRQTSLLVINRCKQRIREHDSAAA